MTKTLRSRLLAVALTVLIASMAMFLVAFAGKGKSASAESLVTVDELSNLFDVTTSFSSEEQVQFDVAMAEIRTLDKTATTYTKGGEVHYTGDNLTNTGGKAGSGLLIRGTTAGGYNEKTTITFKNTLDLTDNTDNVKLIGFAIPNDGETERTLLKHAGTGNQWIVSPQNFEIMQVLIEDVENPGVYMSIIMWNSSDAREYLRSRFSSNLTTAGLDQSNTGTLRNAYTGYKQSLGSTISTNDYTRPFGLYYDYAARTMNVYSAGDTKYSGENVVPQIAKAKITVVLVKNYAKDAWGSTTDYFDQYGWRCQLDGFNMIRPDKTATYVNVAVSRLDGNSNTDPQANHIGSDNAPEIMITAIDGVNLAAVDKTSLRQERIQESAWMVRTNNGTDYSAGVDAINRVTQMGATATGETYTSGTKVYHEYTNVPLLTIYEGATVKDNSKAWYEVSGAEGNANEAIAVPALISHQVLVVEDVTATATKELWQDGAKVQDVTGDTFTVATSGAYTLKYLVDGTEVAEADVKVNTGSVKFDLNGTQITTNWVVGESKEITLDALEAIINEGNKGIYKQVVAFGIDNGEGSAIYTDTETLVLPEVLSILAIDFETIAGASIRLTGAAGLKFTSQLSDESVALLGQIAQNVTYGTIITNADNYESYDLLLDPANEYVEGEDYLNIEAPAFYNGTNAFSGSVIFSDPDTIGDKIYAERFGIGYIKFQLQNGPESFIDIIVYGTTGSDLTANLITAFDVADAYYTAGLETGSLSVEELNIINEWYQLGYEAIEA